jgi:hypothetical protein
VRKKDGPLAVAQKSFLLASLDAFRYSMGERTYSMSSHHFHAVIWIDHHEARVFHFSPTDVERLVLHPDHPTKHIHHKASSIGSG